MKIISLYFVCIFCLITNPLFAQHLYNRDGSIFPLSLSKTISVKFKSSVLNSQKENFLSTVSEIIPEKTRGLPNGFLGLLLREGVTSKNVISRFEQSSLFEFVFPSYRSMEGLLEFIVYDEFLVLFKSTLLPQEIESFCNRHAVQIKSTNGLKYKFVVMPESDTDILSMSNMFFDSLDCQWAVPDFIVQGELFDGPPSDTHFPNQYYLHNTGQEPIPGEGNGTVDADIDALEAWDITKGNPNITIAVIDQGVTEHEDLPSSRLLPGYDFAGSNRNPYDLITTPPDNDPTPDGNEAHGMAFAGIIAATHNQIGISGIVPNSKILPVKIMDSWGYFTGRISGEQSSPVDERKNGFDEVRN